MSNPVRNETELVAEPADAVQRDLRGRAAARRGPEIRTRSGTVLRQLTVSIRAVTSGLAYRARP